MPTYEYTCKSCGDNIEVFQPFSAKPLKTHDVCGGELKKVFHARGVLFKGSGFYVTDSRNGSRSASDSEGNGSAPKKSSEKSSGKQKPTTSSSAKKSQTESSSD